MLEIEVVVNDNATHTTIDPKPRAKTESQFAWMMMKSHWWAVTTSQLKERQRDKVRQREKHRVRVEQEMNSLSHRWLESSQVADAYQWTTANSKKKRAKNVASSVNQWQHTHTHTHIKRRQTHTHTCDADCWKL